MLLLFISLPIALILGMFFILISFQTGKKIYLIISFILSFILPGIVIYLLFKPEKIIEPKPTCYMPAMASFVIS